MRCVTWPLSPGGVKCLAVGGHMVRLLRNIYNVPGGAGHVPDAKTELRLDAACTGALHDRFVALRYDAVRSNRYEGEHAVDLPVPAAARAGVQIIGDRALDGAPGSGPHSHCPGNPGDGHGATHQRRHDRVRNSGPRRQGFFCAEMLARTIRDTPRDL